MIKQLHQLIREIVLHIDGFTINDIMETDYYLLLDILSAEKGPDKVMSLHDFVKSI